jgi:hypothetical protein
MKPWVLWMIRHRFAWLVKSLVVLAYPLHVLHYCGDAFQDIQYILRRIDCEVKAKGKP